MLTKLHRLTTWQAALIITTVGFAVFFTGFRNPFQGDDQTQIVNNPVIHSISHIVVLFEGGSIYNGGGATTPLQGSYYHPLMAVSFSVLYTLFGAHSLYYHLLQVSFVVGSAILSFLVYTRLLHKAVLALLLALIFLVHPLNSQVAFSIPSMQDALYFFFGMLAFWLLLRNKSARSLWAVALCLLLSLFSKETGVIFLAISLLYLYLFDGERLVQFAKIVTLPVIAWVLLRINAVGVISRYSHDAPIDRLSLFGRLMTVPSILQFYLTKLVFPWKLARQYHWVYSSFSVSHVLIPLLIDLAVIALFIMLGRMIKQQASETRYHTYLFFAAWVGLGLVLCIQLIPLDMTASEDWFYIPLAGVLGMVGVALTIFKLRIKPIWLVAVAILLVGVFGVRTALRGTDYSSRYKLGIKDVAASKEDFEAYTGLAQLFIHQGNYPQAETDAEASVDISPSITNYEDLGVAFMYQGNYTAAYQAYESGLRYGNYSGLLDDIAELTLVYGSPTQNQRFFANSVKQYPHDANLWAYYALLFYRYGNLTYAKAAMSYALASGPPSRFVQTVNNGMAKHARLAIVVGSRTVLVP